MNSIRTKLIFMVLVISLSGIASVVITSLITVGEIQREATDTANRQISSLVSRSIQSQVTEYRDSLEYLYKSWKQNPDLQIDTQIFPDYLWIAFVDPRNQILYEWSRPDRLAEAGLNSELLLGKKNIQNLAPEIRVRRASEGSWTVFNSTIQTLLPTILLGSAFRTPDVDAEPVVGFAEIWADRLYSNIQPRKGQELILLDSHQNILLSTREAWDPSELVFQDEFLLKKIADLQNGQRLFDIFDYPNRESQLTSIFKFDEGNGLTLILQEPESSIRAAEKRIQFRSLLIVFVVVLVTVNLLIFFASSMTKPLTQLMKLMEKAGKGEFTGKIKVKAKDEIGRLANVFNKMIAELRQRDDEIERSKSRLIQSEKMSAFGQMSAGIAHEVKNPLAGILGYAQMSKKKLPPGSEVLPYIDIIERESVRCKEIVENLMRFARQEKATFSRIDLNKTVKDSIRLVEHQMSISGIKMVQMFAADGAPIWIKGNANQIQQVMMNLMLNAQQAMENKGTLTISTHYEPENQRVLVMVSDTGHGMTEEVKERIFEPFYTTKGVGKGTGLGLAVSIGIIKDHGGVIDVDSAPGKGTTFSISLPLDEAAAAPDGQTQSEVA